MTFFNELLMTKGIMNDKRSQFNVMNEKKGHNIVNDSFAHEPDGLLVKNDVLKHSPRINKLIRYPNRHAASNYIMY